jgi:type IV pilus assembly protein PilN
MNYQINLLPHRERARAARRVEFYVMLAIAGVIGALASFAWIQWSAARKNEQLKRNVVIEERIKKLSLKIAEVAAVKKELAELKERKDAVTKLQQDRVLPVGFMKDIAQLTPEGVVFTGLKQEDSNKKITLIGLAVTPKLASDASDSFTLGGKWINKLVPQETKEVFGLEGNNASTASNKKDQRKFYLFTLSGELGDRLKPVTNSKEGLSPTVGSAVPGVQGGSPAAPVTPGVAPATAPPPVGTPTVSPASNAPAVAPVTNPQQKK